jgi:hypothetical protein
LFLVLISNRNGNLCFSICKKNYNLKVLINRKTMCFLELLCGFISYSKNLISMVALEKQSWNTEFKFIILISNFFPILLQSSSQRFAKLLTKSQIFFPNNLHS